MRTDLLEARATRLIERARVDDLKKNPGVAPRNISRDLVYEVLLGDLRSIDWTERLKGVSLDFGVEASHSSETFFADDDWESTSRKYRHSGSQWPSKWYSRDEAEVVIRLVGRGSKYAQAVKDQLASLATDAPWVCGVEKLILDGNTSNTRARRVRVRRHAELTGKEVSGTEVQMERTFVARRGSDGFPLASWKLGYRIFFPAARMLATRDAVPVLQLELLDAWLGDQPRPASLATAFLNLIKKIAVQAFMNLGPILEESTDDWEISSDLPFALRVSLPPGMENTVAALHAALTSLFDEDGYSEALCDAHAAVQWIEVVSLDTAPGAIRAQEDAIAKEKKAALETSKAAVNPGDEFMFLEIGVREYCVGRNGLYFPAIVSRVREIHEEDNGETAEETLEEYGVDVSALAALQDPEAVEKVLMEIADVPADKGYNELFLDLRDALWVASAGQVRPATGIRLLVLVDRSTGAQSVELVRGSGKSLISEFLERSTSIPAKGSVPSARPSCLGKEFGDEFDPGGLTLVTRPKRLLVAKSHLNERPEIKDWCTAANIELVHPKSGLGSMASSARVWHADMGSVGHDDKLRAGLTFDALAQRLKELCWVLNEVPKLDEGPGSYRFVPGYYSGQKGAEVELYRAWRAPLVAAAWNCGQVLWKS